MKSISTPQSKTIKFEEHYSCFFGGKYQKVCDNYVIRSINCDKHLQKVRKPTLSPFNEKRWYIGETESTPWN